MKQEGGACKDSIDRTAVPGASEALQRAGQLIRARCRLGLTSNSAQAFFNLDSQHTFKKPGQPLAITVTTTLKPNVKQSAVANLIRNAGAAYSPRSIFHYVCFHAMQSFPPGCGVAPDAFCQTSTGNRNFRFCQIHSQALSGQPASQTIHLVKYPLFFMGTIF